MHRRQTSVVTFTELRHHLEQGSIFIFIFQNEERKEEIEKQFVGRLYKNVNSSKTRSAPLSHRHRSVEVLQWSIYLECSTGKL